MRLGGLYFMLILMGESATPDHLLHWVIVVTVCEPAAAVHLGLVAVFHILQ